jgi:ATP-dependent helicase Lhr and Lhr-like helicase
MPIEFTKKKYKDDEIKKIMHPLMKTWFIDKFKTFSEPQRYAIMNIHSRINTLVSAPTGSGKTLTAFTAILNDLIDLSEKGKLEDKIYCVYISPLKALNADIAVNLIEPLKEIEKIAGKELGIRIGVRTGDTTANEKQKMLKKPPHILITTPESLGIILASIKFKEHLREVQWTIVDEIHALAENKRGVHLSLSLERLEHHCTYMTRVGLSATVAPLEEIAYFLVGEDRDCQIVDVQFLKKYEFKVLSPVPDLINTTHDTMHRELYKLLDKLIQKHKTTLIFTNTRAATERVVDHLKDKFPKNYLENIGAHHGSLGKDHRFKIEQGLRDGKLKVVVSSTSLELGIDIGHIDLVICLGSPKSVARFLQRAGRAGHKLHDTVKGRIIVMDRDDLIECAVLMKAAIEKKIDKVHIPTNCLDVLAQQIDGFALDQVWEEKELFKLVKKSYCYKELRLKDYRDVLSYLAGEYVSLEDRYIYAKIWRNEGKLGKRGKMGRVIYMTNIGTIPDESFITVKIGNQIIGMLDEGFLERMRPGDVFVLGGNTYQFKFSRGMVAQVSASASRPPTVPSWFSEMLPLSFDLSMEIQKFRMLMEDKFKHRVSKKVIIKFINKYLYVDDNSAEAIYKYFLEQWMFCKHIPHDKKILIENYDDGKEKKVVFHALYGRRVNDVLSRAVAFIISRTQHKDIEMGINDNGFYINSKKGVNPVAAFRMLKADKMELLMKNAVDKSEVLRRRFRHCAARSLMILRNYKGRTKRVGRQQVSSMILLSAVKRISNDFSILKEARREVLEDLMDIESAIRVVRWIENGKIKIVEIDTKLPSPFSFNLALQGYIDVLRIEDKVEFIKRMHEMVTAKISLKEGKAKEKAIPDFDYKEMWRKIEEERLQEVDEKTAELKMEVWNLKKVPGYAKTELIRMIDGHKDIRLDVLKSIDEHKKEIKKNWPKKLSKFILNKKKELD